MFFVLSPKKIDHKTDQLRIVKHLLFLFSIHFLVVTISVAA